MSRRYVTSAADYARAALSRGPLVRECITSTNAVTYRFGRRLFGPTTINSLISSGEAIRDGDLVRAASCGADS